MNGIFVVCLYSFGCPEFKEMKVDEKVLNFIKNPSQEKTSEVKAVLEKLEPFLFYQLIGIANSRNDYFSEDIVRAHWLGNEFLKPIKAENLWVIFSQRMIPELHRFSILKIRNLVGGKPHHNLKIFQIFEKIRQMPKIPLESLEKTINCLVLPGRVVEVNEDILVETFSVVWEGDKPLLQNLRKRIEKGFVAEVSKGDFVSIHLGMAREKISKETAENLIKISQESLDFFGGSH